MKYAITIFGFMVFLGCGNSNMENVDSEKLKEQMHNSYYEQSREITDIAMKTLLKSVKKAIDKNGTAHAVEFCNIHASPITDSLSKKFNCEISRISVKNRSKMNAPSGIEETQLLNYYLEASVEEKAMKDTIMEKEGKTFYYRPILLGMEMCLKCHGQIDKDIDDETLTAIYTHYPSDKAVNYRLGDFRGAWKITFND